jgi:sugar lactone lactonase YvrE
MLRRTCILAIALAAIGGSLHSAQAQTGVAATDSANVARAAWGRGMAALQAGDTLTARGEIEHAATAWPTQPTYVWGRALLAAVQGDTVAVMDALDHYARLGLGRDLRADARLAPYAALPGSWKTVAAHNRNRATLPRSRLRARLTDSTFWPEGMDYDPRSGNYYVGSVRHRTIAEVAPGRTPHELWPRGQQGYGSVLGVRVDPKSNVLWATMSGLNQMEGRTPADSSIAALVRVRIADGVVERRWDLPAIPGGHVLGDLAVGPRGDVWVTDSNEPVLYRLRPGADTLARVTHPLFRSLQGMAPTPDGRALYIADYSHGLLRLDIGSGEIIKLEDADSSTSIGLDGIAWDRGAIVGVQNGVAPPRIVRFTLDKPGMRIIKADVIDRNWKIADEPTIGTVVGSDFVYVANSQWEKYDEQGMRKPNTRLVAPILLAVPLPPTPLPKK